MNALSTPMTVVPAVSQPGSDRSASATGAPTRAERRAAIGARFLDALEEIVQRHRSLAPSEHGDLQAELIAAEVAHQLALVRAQLARAPHLR